MGVRFAPSPTGRFHAGNLRTAWISWTLARRLGVPWVVRFEDIDVPRVVAGAEAAQLVDLARLGMEPDVKLVQSAFHARHEAVFERAAREGRVYACTCSRKEVQEALSGMASAPHSVPAVYSGHCRPEGRASSPVARDRAIAWRFRSESGGTGTGEQDFIVARTEPDRDGRIRFTPSYNWACAIDDLDGGYRLLVRASDLAHVAGQQRAIQGWLAPGADVPALFHAALVVRDSGERLEKRTRGVTLDELEARGVTPSRLRELFARSFEAPEPVEIRPGAILAERRAELRLSELFAPSP
jgi:glutamyl-tRNA synthetase